MYVARGVLKKCFLKLNNCTGFSNQNVKRRTYDFLLDIGQPRPLGSLKRWKVHKELDILKKKNCLTLAVYATADRYNLDAMLGALRLQDMYTPRELMNDDVLRTKVCNALHVKGMSNGGDNSHVFYFDVGTVVMWSTTYKQRCEILEFLKEFEERPYNYTTVRESSELLSYKYTECKSSYLHDDVLYFGVAEKSANMIGLNRFVISSAVSLSTKVSALERMMENHFSRMKQVADNMKTGKKLGVKQRHVLATAGLTYATKYALEQSTNSLLLPCEVLNQYKLDHVKESYSNICVYFRIPTRLKTFGDNLVFCERYTTLLFNHFLYCQKARFQKAIFAILMLSATAAGLKYFNYTWW